MPYVKQIPSRGSMYDEGNPEPVLCDSREGWDGREVGGRFQREGTHVYLMPIHVDVQQKSSQYSNYALIKH